MFTYVGQPLQAHIHQCFQLVVVEVRVLQPLVDAHGLELPRRAVAVLQGAQRERLEQAEVLRVVQLEPPRRFGDARFAVGEDLQRPVGQDIVHRRTQCHRRAFAHQQGSQVAHGQLQQGIRWFHRSLVVRDHLRHELTLGPGLRIGRGRTQLGTLHDAPTIALVALPPPFGHGGVQELLQGHGGFRSTRFHGQQGTVVGAADHGKKCGPVMPGAVLVAPVAGRTSFAQERFGAFQGRGELPQALQGVHC